MLKSRIGELALLLLSILLSLVVAEALIRSLNAAPGIEVDQWDKRTKIVRGPEFRYYQEHNSLGVRDYRELSRRSRARRVVFLGDSFTFGLGVSNHQTFSALMEAELNECTGRAWTILNAGRSGTGTVRQMATLRELLESIEVDEVVLFYFIGNDPYESIREKRLEERGSEHLLRETQDRIGSRLGGLKSWLFRRVALYRFVRLRLGDTGLFRTVDYTLADQCDPERVDLFQEADDLTLEALNEMNLRLTAQGIAFSVVVIPRKEQLTEGSFSDFLRLYGLQDRLLDRFLPQERLKDKVLKPSGTSHRDLLAEMQGLDPVDYFFATDDHFNRAGHHFVTQFLASSLIERAMDAGELDRESIECGARPSLRTAPEL